MKMDDAARRLKAQWQRDQKLLGRRKFPLPVSELVRLLENVSARVGECGCDHSLRITREWLEENQKDADPVIDWLGEHGGCCDCEVAANVPQHVEETWGLN